MLVFVLSDNCGGVESACSPEFDCSVPEEGKGAHKRGSDIKQLGIIHVFSHTNSLPIEQ